MAVTVVSLFVTLISIAPIAQQSPNPRSSPFAFILYPYPFEEIRDQTVFIVSVVSIPEEIADKYSLSEMSIFVGYERLIVYPLQDKMIYDPMTKSYIGYYLSIWEPRGEGASLIWMRVTFSPNSNSLLPLFSDDLRFVTVNLQGGWQGENRKEASGTGKPEFNLGLMSATSEYVLYPCPELCIPDFGIECVCPLPDDGTGGNEPTPPDDGTGGNEPTPPDDSGDSEGGGGCGGISYYLPAPNISGRVVQPSEKEIVVPAGDTLTLKADGSPNPDRDRRVSRSYNAETQSCSSSESEVAGPNLSFIWRLWKDDGDGKFDRGKDISVRWIGYGRQIQWQAPSEVGTYWIELVVDDDPYPDYDAPGEKVECEKCSMTSNSDDPPARDWVKVIVKGGIRLLSSYPHHIVYRRPPEPLGPPPSITPVIAPEPSPDPPDGVLSSPAEDDEETPEHEAEVPDAVFPQPEIDEPFEPPITIEPPPDPEIERPTIYFSVEVVGYPSWRATIKIYPAGQKEPIASYVTPIYPASQTSVSISWDTLFPEEKPPSGIYTYDIIVEALETPVTPLTKIGGERVHRLSYHASIQNFVVNSLFLYDGRVIFPSIRFQVVNRDGTQANVVGAWVEFRNFQLRREPFTRQLALQRVERDGTIWWEVNWWEGITIDAPEKLGIWQVVACAAVQEKENGREEIKVVPEAVRVVPIEVTIDGIAFGFAVYDGQNFVQDEVNRRHPYIGWEVHFRVFLKIKRKVEWQEWSDWYSDIALSQDQFKKYSLMGAWHWDQDAPIGQIRPLPDWLKQLLDLKLIWRTFRATVRCQEMHIRGRERWYGMDLVSETPQQPKLSYIWKINDPGTSHWGIRLSWRVQQNGSNGNAVRHQMVFLYPTDRKGGHHLVRIGDNSNEEWHPKGNGWERREGKERFNIVTVGKNQQVTQRPWLPNPEVVTWGYNGIYGWSGKISVRARWQPGSIQFDPNDPFFANTDDKQKAMEEQAKFHVLLMEWAHSFLGAPYSWGGQTYGGRQSIGSKSFTCSADIDPTKRVVWHRVDVVSLIGSSQYYCGYGIDCSGFVGEVAYVSGKIIPDMSAKKLRETSLAKDIDWEYVRPGDFLANPGHVVYARSEPKVVRDRNGKITQIIVECIEAYPGDSFDPRGRVRYTTRSLIGDRNYSLKDYQSRRWIAPKEGIVP